ncbi:nitronate monooxygenase [Paeniglutamicibacter sp. ABSL32-1]|uniref:NAD(P)H-dependent flavin oxidoreductase n=1 Tax=Paeniglutamicibacter quisquiliarum TaxID=2849498 RepID=UPI001C2D8454|nr:nitronate monooxygenase [Paeniglutamicibacter quisquiliarum]MBV1781116.1 nitronate monooxygenase [Paeniglutamicibacter quisquiliarum]
MPELPVDASARLQPLNSLQQILGYTEPIFNAPMAGAAGGALAAAVSAAGGFGMLGIGGNVTKEWIDSEASLAASSGRGWGAGLMAWVLAKNMDPLEHVLAHGPSFVCISFGEPGPAAALAHESGSLVGMQVGNAAELSRALEDDIDVVICRGNEGGGHGRNEVSTLPLLQLALERTGKPVIAAGGLATAAGVAAVLGSGASAAWIGTRFAAATESMSHRNIKEAIGAAGIDDTVYTSAFDIAQRIDWPVHYGGRALRNDFSDTWASDIDALKAAVGADDTLTKHVDGARAKGDISLAPVYAGQSAGLSKAGQGAAEIVADLAGFRSVLQRAARRWETA